jgi:hypothetical protein
VALEDLDKKKILSSARNWLARAFANEMTSRKAVALQSACLEEDLRMATPQTEQKPIAVSLSEDRREVYNHPHAMPDPYPLAGALPDVSPPADSKRDGHVPVRGDSYAHGLSALDDQKASPDERLAHLMTMAAMSYPPVPHLHGPIVTVSSYTSFGDLAHGPRGEEARRALRTYRLNLHDGTLTMLSAVPEGMLHNPAFTRCHPTLNVLYTCTESVKQDGEVHCLTLDGKTGALQQHCPPVSACGTSTCYLTIHKAARRMLLVNYWDSTICTIELKKDGKLGALLAEYDPKEGRAMKATADKHVNHSLNDEAAQAERQGDPHSHAIVLEPTVGSIA